MHTTLDKKRSGVSCGTATRNHDNGTRWYDSTVGRWLSDDPIGFEAADANLYRYCGNAPTLCVDANGMAYLSEDILSRARQMVSGLREAEQVVRMRIVESLSETNGAPQQPGCQQWAAKTIIMAYGRVDPDEYSTKAVERYAPAQEYDPSDPLDASTLLPGDQIWLKNTIPHGTQPMEGGSNTFVVGKDADGNILVWDRAAKRARTIDDYRRTMCDFLSVKPVIEAREKAGLGPVTEGWRRSRFPIIRVRRPTSPIK